MLVILVSRIQKHPLIYHVNRYAKIQNV
jgi:hypothetical protein